MVYFVFSFVVSTVIVFLERKLESDKIDYNWKLDLLAISIVTVIMGYLFVSAMKYPVEYSQSKTETHNLVEYGTNRYFLMSTTTDTTTVLIEEKAGSYHPESFDNNVVSYKRTGDTPQITITYKTAKERPMWKKILFGWKEQKAEKKMITNVKIEFPKTE